MIAKLSVLRCVAAVLGCHECATERLRNDEKHVCDEVCVLKAKNRRDPDGHRRSHDVRRHHCGALLDDHQGHNYEVIQFCGWGTCVQYLCPDCNEFVSGFGPVGCLCEDDPCGHGTYDKVAAPPEETKRRRLGFPRLRRRC